MIWVVKKKNITLLFTGIFFLGVSLGIFNFGLHPNMHKWKQKKLVITEVKTSQKAVALTFDDGPDPTNTPAVLGALKRHNAHATFFILGARAEKYPALLRRMAAEGHEIGNHSYSHFKPMPRDNEGFLDEIKKTNDIIYRHTNQKNVLFRPPGGYLSNALVDLTQKEKITIAYWSYIQDSKDWKGAKANQIANHIIKHIKPGQIIILHDGDPNGLETARAVDMLTDKLSQDGYHFVTMSELIKLGE